MPPRLYSYVGPEDVRAAAARAQAGAELRSPEELAGWLATHADDAERGIIPATFVIRQDGRLRMAHRRSEHVACAAGQPVLSAGELFLEAVPAPRVVAASNLSTGYCPEPESWPAVARALDRANVEHPGRFTSAFDFRRCPACAQRNLVKDGTLECAVCGGALPPTWNF